MKHLKLFLLFVFSISFISASSIDYTIIGEKTLVEIDTKNLTDYELLLPEDYSALDNFSDHLSFITSSLIEKSGKKFLFLVDDPIVKKVDKIRVILPEGYFISEDYPIFPKAFETITNGINIIIIFEEPQQKEVLIFYETRSDKKEYSIIISILLLIIVIGYFLYRFKKKVLFTKNLFKEERKIIALLLKNKKKGVWTKEISKILEISKVKLSRKLRSLEEKGLIKRVPYGNENKIFLRH